MTRCFKDIGQTIYHFGDLFLVHCPHCDHCARVVPLDASKVEWNAPRRLVCARCGYTKDHEGRTAHIGADTDWYFRLPLWLQTPCCGHVLWAYNEQHLDFLQHFVEADLRERAHYTEHDTRRRWRVRPTAALNGTLASRLPVWIKSAKNRDDVLHGIGKLRRMLE